MTLESILQKRNMSMYQLAKKSGVPYATLNDIFNNKVRLEKCNAKTIYKLAKSLDVTMESLLESRLERPDFEIFKSNVCHDVKRTGDIDFIVKMLKSGEIRGYYDKGWYKEAFYLLAMVDYLCRENNMPLCTNYNDIRSQKLLDPVFPRSIMANFVVSKDESYKTNSVKAAIPEFMRFNIVESAVRGVV